MGDSLVQTIQIDLGIHHRLHLLTLQLHLYHLQLHVLHLHLGSAIVAHWVGRRIHHLGGVRFDLAISRSGVLCVGVGAEVTQGRFVDGLTRVDVG